MVIVVYGTRAELIKLSVFIKLLKSENEDNVIIDTGQHDNSELQKALKIPAPDIHFGRSYRSVWSKLPFPLSTALGIFWFVLTTIKLAKVFINNKGIVISHGNTMSSLAAVFAGKLTGKKVLHFESGFRSKAFGSYTLDLMYWIADHLSNYLFVQYRDFEENLKKESISKNRIFFVGNLMTDVVSYVLGLGNKKTVTGRFVLVNSVRSIKNRNDVEEMKKFCVAVSGRVIFSANPIIRNMLEKYGFFLGLDKEKVMVVEPVIYEKYLKLIAAADIVVTDSNGVVEECNVLGKPCIVTNKFTPFRELLNKGLVFVTGVDGDRMLEAAEKIEKMKIKTVSIEFKPDLTKKAIEVVRGLEK
ncbi:MAG: UDP-N-acetylglucosamine 2-epimerase [Candidatus Aenigmarchaeota archaeon]|nr:UDP-N-acetylglucosamine 2-epimerase [Candidatus Aenigmarchaeota archaeon]